MRYQTLEIADKFWAPLSEIAYRKAPPQKNFLASMEETG